MSKDERKAIGVFSEKERDQVEKAIETFPLIDVKVETFVEGEKEIAVGDILTIRITITQTNVKEGGRSGYVHSNKFPFLKQSSWYFVFADNDQNNFFALEKLNVRDKVYVKEVKERMTVAGRIMLNVILKNDSYKGFDKQVKIDFPVLPIAQRANVEYDEEDIQAAKEPSLMQSVVEAGGASDDELEENPDPPGGLSNGPAPHVHGPNCNHGPMPPQQ